MPDALHVVCPHCDATNRLPADRLGAGAKCGKCHDALFTGAPVALDGARFDKHLAHSDLPLVVDFWAAWCGPCRAYAPHFEQLAAARPELRFVKVDSDAAPRASAALQIRSIPTTLLFVGGREVARQSGAMSSSQLGAWIDTALR